jgi:DNA-binding transcriptional ArsR family regulator
MNRRDPGEPDAAVWKALASPIRRRILDALRERELTTGEIADRFPELTRFAVMQHLRVLADADLVVPRRVGRHRYNYLNPVPIQEVVDRWIVPYAQPWTEALVGLRDEVEGRRRPRSRRSPR